MKKNTLIILMVAVVAVIGIAAAVMMMTGDGNDDTKDGKIYSVTLEVAQEDGAYKEYAATGMNVKDILTKTLGDDIVLKSNGNVQSYKNKENTVDESWIVFRWQSLKGWVPAKDTDLRDDSTLVLEYAKKITNNGKTEYVQPGFSISNEVYFFIQIPNMSEIEKIAKDPNSKPDDKSEGKKLTTSERYDVLMGWLEKAGLTKSDIEGGIWVKGSGTNANEALVNALKSTWFPSSEVEVIEDKGVLNYKLDGEIVHGHLMSKDMFGWFTDFLGWADTQLSNGDWTYWSQYTYNPNAKTLDDTKQWTYNNLTLGKYDLGKYRYFGLVLQTTTEKQTGDGAEIVMQTPSEIPEGL